MASIIAKKVVAACLAIEGKLSLLDHRAFIAQGYKPLVVTGGLNNDNDCTDDFVLCNKFDVPMHYLEEFNFISNCMSLPFICYSGDNLYDEVSEYCFEPIGRSYSK